jgi:8-oxo-dGTP pyrophosphatase MutT (NUDIX family)
MDQPEVSPHPQASWVRDDDGTHDQTLVETWLFRLRRERFRSLRSGETHDFFITEIADGVHTIAVTPEDQVVLVRQFRAASGRDSLETPGGLLEPGEDPAEAGARELLEETGYAGDPGESLGILRPNPALLTMAITTVVIRNTRRIAEPQPDAAEELAVELAPASEIPAMIRDGRIDHAVCVAGLLIWLATRDQAVSR